MIKKLGYMALLVVLSAYAGPTKKEGLQTQIENVVSQWKTLFPKTQEDYEEKIYEESHSYILNRGVRGKYYFLKSVLGISILERVSEIQVFQKGPHKEKLNLVSKIEFGYYNPEFIQSVYKTISNLKKERKFVLSTQEIYNQYFQNLLRIFYLSYHHVQKLPNKKEIEKTYLSKINLQTPCNDDFLCEPSYYLQEIFREFAENKEKQGYDVYEGFVAPGFWIRRSIDGTEKEFYQLLELVLTMYDNGFVSRESKMEL